MQRKTPIHATLLTALSLGLVACSGAQTDTSDQADAVEASPEYAVIALPNEAVLGALETRDELDDDDLGEVDAAPLAEVEPLLDEQDYDASDEYLPLPK